MGVFACHGSSLLQWLERAGSTGLPGKLGRKKSPVRSLFAAHGCLTPDGQTILPMRDRTTTRTIAIFITNFTNR
jgi:hypothetical protein